MSAVIRLYNNSSPPNKINKSLSKELEVRGSFKEDDSWSLNNPSILLNIGLVADDINIYNYCYLPSTHRYYFITSVTTEGALTRIECRTDVLMSFKKDILASTQYISRSEYIPTSDQKNKRYLVDNLLPMDSRNSYDIKVFGETVDDRDCIHLILETAGRGGAIE